MFYSTQGSAQQQETGENCMRIWLFWAPLHIEPDLIKRIDVFPMSLDA